MIIANPYHNAQAESFMKTLKVEEVYKSGCETVADVADRLPIFIEQVYNVKRLHSALGYKTPQEFETLIAQLAAQFYANRWSSPGGSLHRFSATSHVASVWGAMLHCGISRP